LRFGYWLLRVYADVSPSALLMLVAQAHSFPRQARLAITLAWIAGYTNVLTMLVCGLPASHVSGTTSQFGVAAVEHKWGLLSIYASLLVTFALGAAISGFCIEWGRNRAWPSIYVLPIVLQAVFLACFAVGVEFLAPPSERTVIANTAVAAFACLAMGLQNATITRISSGFVRTTHVTGVLTDIGLELATLLLGSGSGRRTYWRADHASHRTVAESDRRRARQRFWVFTAVFLSFALGAALGALAHEGLDRLAMFPPVGFLLVIIYRDISRPIAKLRLPLIIEDGELDLPEFVAVFELSGAAPGPSAAPGRATAFRQSKTPHRMPDLLAWSERFGPPLRVLVLDVSTVAIFDENAATELRAVAAKLRARGLSLVLAGLTAHQFMQLRMARGGDELSSIHVRPDIELAIAHAMVLAEMPTPAAEHFH